MDNLLNLRPSSRLQWLGPLQALSSAQSSSSLIPPLVGGTTHRAIGQVLRHLGLVNWFLAGFNILPGLPLDGGRVLRALLWRYNKNFRTATQLAIRSV
jgi:Zn-dependent protease